MAYATEGQPPHVANILVVRDKLVEEGLEPIVVADAALRHQIDDAAQYEKLIDTASAGKRRPVPMQITSFCRSPGS